MLRNYFKIALRNLAKNKVFSFINILGLAVGMAVAMMIGLWIYDEVSFNAYHRNYDRLAQVYINQTFNGTTGTSRAISLPSMAEIKNKYASNFEAVSLGSWSYGHLLVHGEKKINKDGMFVEPVFPQMLSLTMLKGTAANALKDPRSILLSESIAKALFGDANPMNKIIKIDSQNNVRVTGVFEDLPFNSDFYRVQFYLPWSDYVADQSWVKESQQQWSNHSFQCFAQIANHTTMEGVSAKIRDVEKKHTSARENPEHFLHPMSRWHLYSDFKNGKNTGGGIQFVWLFSIIGAFVLLLACINFMNLSTARSEKRAKEVGIRKAVGSQRRQLITQFISESMLVVFFALFLAIVLVLLSIPAFNELAGKKVSLPYQNPAFWGLLLSFSLITGLLSGSYPAFYLSSFNPLKVLKGTFKVGRWATLPRKVLVVIQFTVSITLIIGTLMVFRQIQHAKNRPVGYNREGLLQIYISSTLRDKYDPLRNDLLKSGAVFEVSKSSSPTTYISSNQIGFEWEGKDPQAIPLFGVVACSHDFGKTIGWQIKEGRDFSRKYSTDSSAFVLNEAAVKLTGLKDIVGKIIRYNGKSCQVVGVVKDMVMESPYTPIKPTIFMINYDWASVFNVKLMPNAPVETAVKKVEAVFKKYDPDTPFSFQFADEEYNAKFRAEERVGKLARIFATLAIFISCLGLFGLASFVAEQRIKEIGVRKVLGASVFSLWSLLSKDFVRLVLISFLIAIPIAYYFLSDWLLQYEYRTTISWWVFGLSGLGAAIITIVTVSFQAIKAALMNPVKSLRSE
ncbi:ABC transporter permease [Larkinella humicola]|uniref:FtsX-like permease family protein n=1 Tax=Larkinella humicola TaxID=2607654 RepID=A0A5N1JH69_9BACT|nr:ABC transporter permease [Larkinella humicola]KAA9354735.1 FtsX-like permease family protein [Larkinella humicola]